MPAMAALVFSIVSRFGRFYVGAKRRPHLTWPSRDTPEDRPWGSSPHIGPPGMAGMPRLQEQIAALCGDGLGTTLRAAAVAVMHCVRPK